MLIRQPRGTTSFVTVTETPPSKTHLIVTGSVAADDAVPQAVIQAGLHVNQIAYGLFCVIMRKRMGMMINRCSTIPARVPPMRIPRFIPISATSTRNKFGMIRWRFATLIPAS
jgi:hypothetical protein